MKVAIVLGGAECVWRDYAAARALLSGPAQQFIINDHIASFPGEAIGVTLHPDKLRKLKPHWLSDRKSRGLPDLSALWSHRAFVEVTNHIDDWGGSSGLFACRIARHLGFAKIVLCGVPMTVEDCHFVRHQRWNACHAFRRAWEKRLPEIAPYVRSLSGWTREMLGEPSRDWLAA